MCPASRPSYCASRLITNVLARMRKAKTASNAALVTILSIRLWLFGVVWTEWTNFSERRDRAKGLVDAKVKRAFPAEAGEPMFEKLRMKDWTVLLGNVSSRLASWQSTGG